MPSLPVNTSVSVSLPAGSSINITGNGAWAFIATVSGREIASGSYVGPDVVGPFTRAAVVGLTATVSDGLQYTVQDFAEGNAAAAALTTEQVTALQSVVSGYGNVEISGTGSNRLMVAADFVTDDSAAVQAEINRMSETSRGTIKFPLGGKLKISSPLTIKAGVCALDLNGGELDCSGLASNAVALTINPATDPYGDHAMTLTVLQNGTITGLDTDAVAADGIKIDRASAGVGVLSGMVFRNLIVQGFRDNIYYGDGAYINHFHNVNSIRARRYGLNYPAQVYAGENLSWFGGRISDCSNASGTGRGVYMPSGGKNELHLFGTSLDYNDINADIRSGRLKVFGGNIENDNGASPMILVDATGVGDWVEVYLASDVSWTEASPGRAALFSVTGDNAFFDISPCHFYGYNLTGELVKVVSGRPKINYKGTHLLATGAAGLQPAISYYASEVLQSQDATTPATSPWQASSGNVALSVGTGAGRSGGNAIRMTWTGSASANAFYRLPVSAGQSLHAEAWVNVTSAPGSTNVYFRVRWRDYLGNLLPDGATENINRNSGASSWSATNGGFERISARRNAPRGAAFVDIDFWNTNTAAVIDVDDVHAWIV